MRHALVIGSNGPKETDSLKYARTDADAMRNSLESPKCRFVVHAVKKNATAWQIRERLSEVASQCTCEDTLLCYFSGHAELQGGELFLLCDRTDRSRMSHTSIPVSHVREVMTHCQAQSRLVILDSCHAGAAIDWSGLKGNGPEVGELIPKPENYQFFLASSRLERAREVEALKGGFLTHTIVRALTVDTEAADRDRDGIVSSSDLELWSRERAIEHNRANPSMAVPLPYLYGLRRGDFSLTVGDTIPWPWTDSKWGIKTARDFGINGQGVRVFIFDSGCDGEHAQLRHSNIEFRYVPVLPDWWRSLQDCAAFDTDLTGTANCGIIAGKDIGIAPGVELHVASIVESETSTTAWRRLLRALQWVREVVSRDNAKPCILVTPLGYPAEPLGTSKGSRSLGNSTESSSGDDAIVIRAILDAYLALERLGVLCIASSGNDGPGTMKFPACLPNVLAVGAVDRDLRLATFSSFGQGKQYVGKPEIVGLGAEVYSSIPRNSKKRSLYEKVNGTAMAAAYVAGIAALQAQSTGYRGRRLRDRLLQTALRIERPARGVGAGLARFVS